MILDLVHPDADERKKAEKQVNDLANKGFAPLASRVPMPRENGNYLDYCRCPIAPATIRPRLSRTARKMGLQVRMVTGDNLAIAQEVSRELKLGPNIAVASDLFPDGKADDTDKIDAADGYAEVFPEHKFKIVKALQAGGHIVGMTGDGVNDAPALKKADCGIAVSGATDAARAAADLVLTAKGLSVITAAISEARKIFERMNSYAIYRISETIRVLLFMTLAILIFNFFPVTAVMIVLIAVLNDFPIMMIAYDNTIVAPRPVRWDMERVLTVSSVIGVIGVIASFSLFLIAEKYLHMPRPIVQSLMFLTLLVCRTPDHLHDAEAPEPSGGGHGPLAPGGRLRIDSSDRNAGRSLWMRHHDAARMEIHNRSVGLCARMVFHHRYGEACEFTACCIWGPQAISATWPESTPAFIRPQARRLLPPIEQATGAGAQFVDVRTCVGSQAIGEPANDELPQEIRRRARRQGQARQG